MSTRPESMKTVEFGWPGRFVDEDAVDLVPFAFEPTRREVVGALGAGLLIAVMAPVAGAQQRQGGGQGRGGRGGGGPRNLGARIHLARDGTITVMTGKVEGGQGSRAQLTQAAAEELRIPVASVKLIMADTALVPDDGITAGSRSTPSTVPSIRQGAAAAREMLVGMAAKRWGVERAAVVVKDGKASSEGKEGVFTYGELAGSEEAEKLFGEAIPRDVTVTAVGEWKTLGTVVRRPNARELVTGGHEYPSDIKRPGMWYGKVLRAVSYGAKRTGIDLAPAKAMKDLVVVEDGEFVGVVAPSSYAAERALEAVAKTAKWESPAHVSGKELYGHLRDKARGGVPENAFKEELAGAAKRLKQTYHVAYAQHAPMEPRAAVAEWEDGKLTVWTATQNPFGVRGELMRAFRLAEDRVRVIVPDFGGGFGGKHSGECAVEAARLAQGARRPVCLRWTRSEEFTWAYFRPAAVIEAEASLDAAGKLTSWYFININSGQSAVDTPYRVGKKDCRFIASEAPLRHGSYRALASTANTFARECFMDELAEAAGADPLEFRRAHLENERLRAVLEAAAEKFAWKERVKKKDPRLGVGLACGTEKGSYVAACAEVEVDGDELHVKRVCQAYECGKIMNPENVMAQVKGAIVQGLGPALREEVRFENGKVQSDNFSRYRVPRFADVPEMDVVLLDRADLASVGAGETPIIAVAPAIANAVFHARGIRVRQMPVRLARA